MHHQWIGWLVLVALIIVKFAKPAWTQSPPPFHVAFGVESYKMHMNTIDSVNITISDINVPLNTPYKFYVKCDKEELAIVNKVINNSEINGSTWTGTFDIQAEFLGNAKVYVELDIAGTTIKSDEVLNLIIIREERVIDHVFTGSVILLVSLLYINFGAALDLASLKGIVRRPIGPAIGFVSQFLLMPLLSFGLGYALFPDSVELHLGLFFTGVSPSGGASNIWTVILQGNINLSIAMTTLGNFAAFGMIPFWIFTLGSIIFERGNMVVPYKNIGYIAVSLIVPLAIGVAIQKFMPRAARLLVRLLKPISMLLILFIVIFAIATNLYLFQLFSWQIIISGLALPTLGYTFGWIIAKMLKQTSPDALAIAIETGVQNTGIAIFLLRFSLPQPQADLTTVVPVCVATMTPLPLFVLYIIQKIRQKRRGDPETEMETKTMDACEDLTVLNSPPKPINNLM